MTQPAQAKPTGTLMDAIFDESTDLETVQRQLLSESVLVPNRCTAYGEAHGFSDIDSAESYRDRVPLVDYEAIRPWVDRVVEGESGVLTAERVMAFFKTSGSLAKPKLIPVTTRLMRQKVGAFATYWEQVYDAHPAVRHGTMVSNFTDASEPERTDAGLEIHSESGFWARRGRSLHSLNRWPLPREIRRIKNTDVRLFVTARFLLQTDLHCIMCLNPSTLLQFCRLLQSSALELADAVEQGGWGSLASQVKDSLADKEFQALESHLQADSDRAHRLRQLSQSGTVPRLVDIWPELSLVICWSSAVVQPYFVNLAPFINGVAVRDYITQSSECMMAIPFEDGSSGGVLAFSTHFFEFIPEAETTLSHPSTRFAWQLEEGQRYEVVVSTGGGLYRYRMGDCIVVKGFRKQAPIIEFLYRIGRTSSMTGEKLTEFQVIDAAARASRELEWQPEEYLCYPCTGATPHYGLLIDAGADDDCRSLLTRWLAAFDRCLGEANPEYADKCRSGRLGLMRAWQVAPYSLRSARHARRADGVSEEQVKSEVLTSQPDKHLEYALVCVVP